MSVDQEQLLEVLEPWEGKVTGHDRLHRTRKKHVRWVPADVGVQGMVWVPVEMCVCVRVCVCDCVRACVCASRYGCGVGASKCGYQ